MDIVLKYEGVWQVLFSAKLFRKSTVIFPEISGKIPPEISGNFRTHNPTGMSEMMSLTGTFSLAQDRSQRRAVATAANAITYVPDWLTMNKNYNVFYFRLKIFYNISDRDLV